VTTRQVAVPLVAAVLGGAITAAAMVAGGGAGGGSLVRQQGLLSAGSRADRLSANEIYDRAAPSVVYISARSVQPGNGGTAFDSSTGSEFNVSTGSGFVLDDDGHVITNAHVVSGITSVDVTFQDGPTVAARVIGKDEQTDIAVLAVDTSGLDLRPLELGDSSSVRPGDPVVVLGNPTGELASAGTGRIAAEGREVQAPGGYLIDNVFETDAVIEPATSGGPLLDAAGRVVGIASRMPGEDGATGFAVPANTARDVVGKIEESGKVVRPYIGLRGTATHGGVQVSGVYTGGPADKAGIHIGDVIESIDSRPVTTLADLFREVDRHAPGDSVELGVLRDGSRGGVKVTLLERPATAASG
jgi:S1-C subfamily serine protease